MAKPTTDNRVTQVRFLSGEPDFMILHITKEYGKFVVDESDAPGSPPVGRGRTIMEAIGNYFHNNQSKLCISFVVEQQAVPAEMRRRNRELKKR